MTSNAHGFFRAWTSDEIDQAIRLHGPPHNLGWAEIGKRIGRTPTAVKNAVYKARGASCDADMERQKKANRKADARFIAKLNRVQA